MSQHNEEVKVNFSGTAILSFVVVLAFLLLMANCHGQYKGSGQEKNTTEQKA